MDINKMSFDKRRLISIVIALVISIIVAIILLIPDVSRSFNTTLARMRLNRTIQTFIRAFVGIVIVSVTFLAVYKTSLSIIHKMPLSQPSPPMQQPQIQQPKFQQPLIQQPQIQQPEFQQPLMQQPSPPIQQN
jgi:ABC-type uncharacterized transport system fused permease/ATPase subunit